MARNKSTENSFADLVARLKEMSPSDIEEARRINGGRLVYKLIVPQGLPYAGAITAETGGSPNMM